MLKYDFSIDAQEDEDLRCPICNYYFSNLTKPYLLPCNHNLCLKCVDSIIAKKMFSCPICRKAFNDGDQKNFQVNFAFLNLVIKILKTKVIYCTRCSKIFNWVEHHSQCDQSLFKETNEIMEEVKKLAEECFMILKYFDKHKSILNKSKKSIFSNTNDLIKILNLKFSENFQKTIENFYSNIPQMNFEIYMKDILLYLEHCKPFSNLDEGKKFSMFAGTSSGLVNETSGTSPKMNYKKIKKLSCDSNTYNSGNSSHLLPMASHSANFLTHKEKIHRGSGNNNLNMSINLGTIGNNLSSKYFKKDSDFEIYHKANTGLIQSETVGKKSKKFISNMNDESNCGNRSFNFSQNLRNSHNLQNSQLNSPAFINEYSFKQENSKNSKNYKNEKPYIDNNNTYLPTNSINLSPSNPFYSINKIEKLKSKNLNQTADGINKVNTFNVFKYLNQVKSKSNAPFLDEEDNIEINNQSINEEYNVNPISKFNFNSDYIQNEDLKDLENFNDYVNLISNVNIDDTIIDEETNSKIKTNKFEINLPKRDNNNNQNYFSTENEVPQMINSNTGQGTGMIQNTTNNNTNIVNFNYNFNITELIDENSNLGKDKKEKNEKNEKIVVRNDKIEIINVNNENSKKVNYCKEIENFQNFQNFQKIENFERNSQNKTDSKINFKNKNKDININSINSITNTDKEIIFSTKTTKPDTPKSHQDLINLILTNFNKTKEIVSKILNYTTQVEFVTETIKNQISTNYNILNESILGSMNSLYDNISTDTNYTHRSYKKFLVNFIENTKKIWLFDVKKMKCEIKEFQNSLSFKLGLATSIEFDDNDLIFITGGRSSGSIFESEPNFSNYFAILRWSNKQVEHTNQMPRKRGFHSSIYFDNKLYVIGGASNSIQSTSSLSVNNLKDCECYNIIDKRWEFLPSMNYGRCNPSLCMYNGAYLYAFRGWSYSKEDSLHLDTIEFLNIKQLSQWTLIKPEDKGMTWLPGSNSVATVLSNNQILICGGSSSNSHLNQNSSGNKFNNCTYIYDPVLKSVYRSKDMLKSAAFNTNGTVYENSVILIDWKNETGKPFGVHVYDMENKIWKFNQN